MSTRRRCTRARSCIRTGVTSVWHAGFSRDWSQYEEGMRAALRAYADSGIRVSFGVHVMDRSTFVYHDDDAFMASLAARRRSTSCARRWSRSTSPRSTTSGASTRRVARRVRRRTSGSGSRWARSARSGARTICSRRSRRWRSRDGAAVQLHCLESPYQREYLTRLYGKPTLGHLADLGLAGPHVSLAHGVWATAEDLVVCAENDITICNNPSSNLRLRVGGSELLFGHPAQPRRWYRPKRQLCR